jgi:opacity protein-like surface antigen
MRTAFRRAAVLAATLASPAVFAQTTIESANDWKFEFVPYVWLAGVRTDLKVGPLPTDTFKVSSGNVLKALDFAAMGTLEARKGDWGGMADLQYIRLGVSNQLAGGLLGNFNVRLVEQIYTVSAFYRVVNSPSVEVDVLGGARYANIETTMNIDPSLLGPGRSSQDTSAWWNGIVGVRALVPLNDKWKLLGYLDVGDGSGSTSWQAIAGASYQYSPTTSFKFGYRYLSFDRKDDERGPIKKMAMGGIYLGAGFNF